MDISEASIDCAVMYAVMEHLDPSIINSFFSELRRILKPKGLLFIAKLPRKLSYQEHLAHFLRIPHHDRLYTRRMVNDVLNENGFDILRIEKTGLFFNHPNRIVNPLFRLTTFCENVINRFFPPLKIFAHDYRIVAVKK